MDTVERHYPLPLPVTEIEAMLTTDVETTGEDPRGSALVAPRAQRNFSSFESLQHTGILAH